MPLALYELKNHSIRLSNGLLIISNERHHHMRVFILTLVSTGKRKGEFKTVPHYMGFSPKLVLRYKCRILGRFRCSVWGPQSPLSLLRHHSFTSALFRITKIIFHAH
jgi:hypothetical protein